MNKGEEKNIATDNNSSPCVSARKTHGVNKFRKPSGDLKDGKGILAIMGTLQLMRENCH